MIPIFKPQFEDAERNHLLECIDTGWISSQGRFIPAFETAFAAWNGVAHGVAASSCTTALHLALAALGVGPGDEVLCPDLTFIAPANMVRLTGATPILVDVEPESWAIDPIKAAAKITPETKAMIVVHPFGHAADMDSLLNLAKIHDLKIIEDVAEAPGGTYKDRMLGSIGDISCYSFFANKIMTTGEGGMVLCNDPTLDTTLRVLRDHGMSREKRYVHDVAGFNYRMTNMQAAVGLAQLERLDTTLSRRAEQATQYEARFAESSKVAWRPSKEYCRSVHWMATITLRRAELRDPLLQHLVDNGIDARQMIFPVHMAAPYAGHNNPADFPVTRAISLYSLHLPSSTGLSRMQVDKICDAVLGWVETHDLN